MRSTRPIGRSSIAGARHARGRSEIYLANNLLLLRARTMCGKSFLAILTAILRAYDRLQSIDYDSGRRRRRRRRRGRIGSDSANRYARWHS